MTIWTRKPLSTPLSAAYASYFISFMCGGSSILLLSWASDLYVDQHTLTHSFFFSFPHTPFLSLFFFFHPLPSPPTQLGIIT